MREVDLELDFCPKCAPEETQNPFPVQEHRFYNSFAAVVQSTGRREMYELPTKDETFIFSSSAPSLGIP